VPREPKVRKRPERERREMLTTFLEVLNSTPSWPTSARRGTERLTEPTGTG